MELLPLHTLGVKSFGHTQDHYIFQAICVSCGQKAQSSLPFFATQWVNCDGPHGSNSWDCIKFLMEREIQKIRVTDKVSLPEAWHRNQAQHLVDFSWSFVSVLKFTNSTSSSSQTIRPTSGDAWHFVKCYHISPSTKCIFARSDFDDITVADLMK